MKGERREFKFSCVFLMLVKRLMILPMLMMPTM